jgi:AhpD family alkylhydroperoxidase
MQLSGKIREVGVVGEYFYGKDDIAKVARLHHYHPDIVETMMQSSARVMAEGALSTKVKELIAVACAHITQCPYCINDHARSAKAAGVTEAELSEAILVAVNLASGAALAHASIAFKAYEE